MDFATLPPEINSGRMYAGPGSGPLLLAAAGWDQLALEMHSAAASCRSVTAGLATSAWQGPSSMRMEAAVAPYLTWMHSTAASAEQTAAQARTAAGAYQAAFAATVPPPLIAANRVQLAALVANNYFGQNSPAIAATEARYDQMWAQDAAAMYGYAASSAAATKLPSFTSAPGVAASPVAPATPVAAAPSLLTYLLQIPSLTSAAASISSSSFGGASIATTNHAVAVNALRDDAQGIGPFLVESTGPLASAAGLRMPPASAAVGRASLVSALSVPQTWTAAAPAGPAAVPLPAAVTGVAPAAAALPAGGVLGETLLGTLAGRGVCTAAAKARRPSVIPRTPAAG